MAPINRSLSSKASVGWAAAAASAKKGRIRQSRRYLYADISAYDDPADLWQSVAGLAGQQTRLEAPPPPLLGFQVGRWAVDIKGGGRTRVAG